MGNACPTVTAVICDVLYNLGSHATVNFSCRRTVNWTKGVHKVCLHIYVILHYRPVMFRRIRRTAKGDYELRHVRQHGTTRLPLDGFL